MQERLYPMNRPDGHVPPIPRYSAHPDIASRRLVALFVGVQSKDRAGIVASGFEKFLSAARRAAEAPAYLDRAAFVDSAGFNNSLAAMYWPGREAYDAWAGSEAVRNWRTASARPEQRFGWWWEPISVPVDRAETIAFKEFLRGVSACPFSKLEPTASTGYWGAARDRIPASGYDRLAGSAEHLTFLNSPTPTHDRQVTIRPPRGMAIIRSGVSWDACGEEQLLSYEQNVRPKLDAGMKYLVDHPLESGCCSLRQVVALDDAGAEMKEGYSLGAFLSLDHLESWSKHHPTHLAIYHRAMMERKKFQERLQLRTYNEIFVVDEQALDFEYFNCHQDTGLLRYFPEIIR